MFLNISFHVTNTSDIPKFKFLGNVAFAESNFDKNEFQNESDI